MIRCIAIDDEPLALKQMEGYIVKTPFLELQASFGNPLEALDFLSSHESDLIFIDINMPDITGMELVKTLHRAPMIIFTTAHSEYAVEGYKVDALDYLLKPIAYADFLKAAQKARERWKLPEDKEAEFVAREDFLFVKSDYKVHRVLLSEIKYIEGMREYVKIHLDGKKALMPLVSMKKLEEKLPNNRFMRVHRSFIVNLEKVNTIERNRIVFDENIRIPVGEQYKQTFQQFLDEHFF